ncbi:stage IV sporulation protein FA [Siminovitchia fordii]|uniref:Stage IV sporulation protein FA n=2 Tax=Siminovitchia fordii TaxID=254759 RepID=A0ABQ4KAB5_9BACI|nr:stage IV sporulation protein FA [Siminovitchia fordii]
MMSHRVNKIRKRIAKRRRESGRNMENPNQFMYDVPDSFSDNDRSIYEPKTTIHPLWRKEIFMLKLLSSIALILVVGILFQSPSPAFDHARSTVKKAMGKEFQFAAVANWYENQFGKPLVLFPNDKKEQNIQLGQEGDYALPVGAKISEGFSQDGRGVMFQTESAAEVKAAADGIVIFSGKKEDIGQTVIIQHSDHTESWYGKMDQAAVKPHEHVKGGQIIGRVSSNEDQNYGEYYFAIKKEDEFVDPIQVMNLD